MTRIDPKLIRELEKREDANTVLAEALGLCPTCGQRLPERAEPTPNKAKGDKRLAVLAWRRENPENKNQSQCARDVGCSIAYVGRIWHEDDAETPHAEAES